MYNITDYTFERAKEINVIVQPSKRKNKKIDVYNMEGQYITSVGYLSMSDYPTYIKTHGLDYANERRKRFYQRFNNIQVNTTMWYTAFLLW